jgi:hypothetical protein
LYKGENGGVMKEHLWCRADGKSSLFDVSHMGQVGNHNDTGSRKSMWRIPTLWALKLVEAHDSHYC